MSLSIIYNTIRSLRINCEIKIYYLGQGCAGKMLIKAHGPNQFDFNHETDTDSRKIQTETQYTLSEIHKVTEEILKGKLMTKMVYQPALVGN